MGSFSKKTKTKTTPIVTPAMQPGLDTFGTKSQDFLNTDPHQYVAPASPLQEQAFAGVQNLGGWKPSTQQATDLATQVANKPATTVSLSGYTAPKIGALPNVTAAQVGNAPTFSASQLGAAPTFDAAQIGPLSTVDFQSILDNGGVAKYMNPAVQSYVDTTLADYDQNAAQKLAEMRAQAAGAGAFGGSRYGISEGQFTADTARGRASTEADLRRQAYENAVQTALAEGAQRSQLGMFNAGQANTRAGQQAEMEQVARAQNASMLGQYGLHQADIEQATRAANANMLGQYGLHQADLTQQAGLADAENKMRAALAQLGVDADALQFGANAQNTQALTNAQLQDQAYQRMIQGAGLIGDLGNQYAANERGDLAVTGDLGAQQRAIAAEYANAVPTQLQLARLLYPPEAYVGSNSVSKSSGGLGTAIVGGLAQGIGSAIRFSDRRLKTDIERIGAHGPIGLYRFRLRGDQRARTGVMADEVEQHFPEALGPIVDGYATVNYDRLGLGHLVEG